MKHTINLYTGKAFPSNLMGLLDAFCDHVFVTGSANLVGPRRENIKSILDELEAAAKLHIQVQNFLKGKTKEVQLPEAFIFPIISFMRVAKLYDPEIVVYLIALMKSNNDK